MQLEIVFPKLPHFANLGVGLAVTVTDKLILHQKVFVIHQNVR